MASRGDKPVYFNRKGAERIAKVVKRAEHAYRNEPAPRGRYPIASAHFGQVAKVKTTVSARSGNTVGTGTVTFQILDGSTYGNGADDIPVKNPYSSSLAVGTWVTLVETLEGWTVFGANC